MLEDLAIRYVSQPDATLRIIAYCICIVGAVIAGVVHKGHREMQRSPYFALSGLLFVITAAFQSVWLGSIQAINDGFLWVFMLVDVAVGLAVGYAFGVIAMARSRDAFGHARMAVLAFIPIANFWLLLKPSRNEDSTNRATTFPLLNGWIGVLSGVVLLVAGAALATFIRGEILRTFTEVQDDPATQRASISLLLRGQGLEATLRHMSAGVENQPVDEATTLLRIEGDGTTLRYIYEVTSDMPSLPNTLRARLIKQNCDYEALRLVIDAGATIQHVYRRPDGSEIGTVTVTQQACSV